MGELRTYCSSGIVSGGVAGLVVGLADALFSGSATMGVVALYLAAAGVFVGGLVGLVIGLLLGAVPQKGASEVTAPARAAGWAAAATVFVAPLPFVTMLFASTFRNRDLSALALAFAALGLALVSAVVGVAVAGVSERWFKHLTVRRKATLAKAIQLTGVLLVALMATLGAFLYREHVASRDLGAGALLLVWGLVTVVGARRLARRGFRLTHLPWVVRRGLVIVLVCCGYATYQMAIGSAPSAVAAARTHVSLADLAIARVDPPAPLKKARRVLSAAPASKPKPSLPPRPSVLLVTLDSARPDRMSMYGYARPTTPQLAAFSRRCVVFERAYAASSKERDGIPALMAGKLPSQLVRTARRWPRHLKGNEFLAEKLRREGYHASAVVSHAAHGKRSGLQQGFDLFDDSAAEPGRRLRLKTTTSAAVTERAVAALQAQRKQAVRLVWAHYADPHQRYIPDPQGAQFGGRRADRYDAELARTDAQVGKLLAAAQSFPSPLWIVVVGDHGENLGERGRFGHGWTLRDRQVRVPLMICAPGLRPRRISTPVSVLDLYPTLLEATRSGKPRARAGRSLLPVLKGTSEKVGPVICENSSGVGRYQKIAIVDGKWKLTLIGASNYPRLVDLTADPGERRNLARRRRGLVSRLRTEIFRARIASRPMHRGKARVIAASEDSAELEALKRRWRALKEGKAQPVSAPKGSKSTPASPK